MDIYCESPFSLLLGLNGYYAGITMGLCVGAQTGYTSDGIILGSVMGMTNGYFLGALIDSIDDNMHMIE